ncbi:MAG: TetR/AcrR family transcriptional regulator [Actinoallomurus sp.]
MRSTQRERGTFTENARRRQIVDCAVEVIAEIGYTKASIRRIAERVGVAMSVVLYHVASKDDLVGAIVAESYRSALELMVPAVTAETTARGKLDAYIRSNGEFVHAHRSQQLALADIWSNHRSPEGLRLDQLGLDPQIQDELARIAPEAIFVAGRRNGEFRAFPPRSMALALRGALDAAVAQTLQDPSFDVRGYCRDVADLFDRATRAEADE